MSAPEKPNDQYNRTTPNSLANRTAARVRHRLFRLFMERMKPRPEETVLDIGVTSDQAYASSNYFEELYPNKEKIVAAGIDDAAFLERHYPGLRFLQADALRLPFRDGAFDLVHSSAVLEHVGSRANQAAMIAECLRVARRGICLTTPNRWFPIEFHTLLPLVHWLPPARFRAILRRRGMAFFADEANLNLLSRNEIRAMVMAMPGWSFEVAVGRLLGWPSNLVLFASRAGGQARPGSSRF